MPTWCGVSLYPGEQLADFLTELGNAWTEPAAVSVQKLPGMLLTINVTGGMHAPPRPMIPRQSFAPTQFPRKNWIDLLARSRISKFQLATESEQSVTSHLS